MQQFSFIDLFIELLNLLYMFRATNSHIFRNNFDSIQLWYNAPILLPIGDKVEMEVHINLVTGRHEYRYILPKLYIQSKSAPENGRVCHLKHA